MARKRESLVGEGAAELVQPGKATIYSVAARAGVSIATVSRVLSGSDTASPAAVEKVLTAARDLNYVPQNSARSLASRRYQAHALVIGAMSGPYYSELMMGYEEAATRHGQSLVLAVLDPDRDGGELRDLQGRVDGVVIANALVPAEAVQRLANQMPVVLVGRPGLPGCDVVISPSADSAAALTRHLLDHGHRRLVFLGDPDGAEDVRDRCLGFTTALSEAGLRPAHDPVRLPYTEQAGRGIVAQLLAWRDELDGVVCANDELALEVVVGLRSAGVAVGTEIAVTGWDDVMSARYITPGLTTVAQPVRAMGSLAADLLHERITGRVETERRQELPTRLIIRQSCGCAAPAA